MIMSSPASYPTSYPPFFEVTDDNRGPYAVVVAFSSIVLMVSVAVIRYLLAGRQKVELEKDDTFFAVAVAFAIANALCFYRAVVAGLGKHIDDVGSNNLVSYYKLMYTAQLLGIFAQGASKTSMIMLYRRITPERNVMQFIFLVCIGLWVIISTFLFAFQCALPKPWIFAPSQCTTHGRVQFPIIVFNMITDTMLFLGILPIVWILNTSHDTRFVVILLFSSRLLVVAMSIGLLVSVSETITDTDQTWSSLPRAIWDMSVVFVSVVTATIPRTNTFWVSLQSGKASAGVTDFELSNSPSHGLSLTRGDKKSNKKNNSNSCISSGSQSRTHSLSDEPNLRSPNSHLRLIPKTGNKVSTKIFSDSADRDHGSDETELVADSAPVGGLEDDDRSQSSTAVGTTSAGIYRSTQVSVVEEHVTR
ncbi:hypothetical protein F5884DRAFT_263455 [Xylogone sp. PMI_703]|nr:hypothetical protein F5884DRAFT_263455 [Xylogone sp. PMI_703]